MGIVEGVPSGAAGAHRHDLSGSIRRVLVLVAGTRAPGGFSLWLCQPLEGPSIYRDLVEEGIPGPHFITVWRKTEAESRAVRRWFEERGATERMAARLRNSIEFAFLDAREQCGMIVETGSGDSADQPLENTYP